MSRVLHIQQHLKAHRRIDEQERRSNENRKAIEAKDPTEDEAQDRDRTKCDTESMDRDPHPVTGPPRPDACIDRKDRQDHE